MSRQRVVVIGASAGGVEALLRLNRSLSPSFAAPIVAVIHISSDAPSLLAPILTRGGNLPAFEAVDGAVVRPGTIHVAVPDRHLLIEPGGVLRVVRGPRENRHRPAIDPLFRSAATAFGAAAIGVILTGNLDDGTAGLLAIKERNGLTFVQDPEEALAPSMPRSAIDNVRPAAVLTLDALARRLEAAVREPLQATDGEASEQMVLETKMAELDPEALDRDDRPGEPSPFACPECGGVLREIADAGDFVRYRCHVGHAYSPENMASAQGEMLEQALWTALKTLEESARLSNRLTTRERQLGHDWMAERFAKREADAREQAEWIRRFLRDSPLFDGPERRRG